MNLIAILKDVTAQVEVLMETTDRSASLINTVVSSVVAPLFHAKSFPSNIGHDSLGLLRNVAARSSTNKVWKKEMGDAFNDSRLLTCPPSTMEGDWFPVLQQWIAHDKDRLPELISRLTPPSSAGIMFGVGASAARVEADRKTQLNLRRICLVLLATSIDTCVAQLRDIWEKIVELLEASMSSSPSASVKSEVFMLCRALTLSTSTIHLSPFWPILNSSLQLALISMANETTTNHQIGNLGLLQACKLMDLLIALAPDEFQLHEWLYITDTVDAVYQPSDWSPVALSDRVAEQLTAEAAGDGMDMIATTAISSTATGRRRPLIGNEPDVDTGDYKAMGRHDFARIVLRPFLSQLSMNAYEGVYRMEAIDLAVWRRNLLEDILDLHTIVD